MAEGLGVQRASLKIYALDHDLTGMIPQKIHALQELGQD